MLNAERYRILTPCLPGCDSSTVEAPSGQAHRLVRYPRYIRVPSHISVCLVISPCEIFANENHVEHLRMKSNISERQSVEHAD